MNSKALDADFVYAWENAEMGILPAKEATTILYPEEKDMAVLNGYTAEYKESHNSTMAFAKRAQVDRVIDAKSTRKYLVSAFDLLFTKYSCVQDKKHNLR